jgi:hypothetical protein
MKPALGFMFMFNIPYCGSLLCVVRLSHTITKALLKSSKVIDQVKSS